MSAQILPYRFTRRMHQIRETAGFMATVDAKHADGHLRYQLRRLEDSLRRKGVAEDLIRSEVASYEGAVRSALWRLLLIEGGAA